MDPSSLRKTLEETRALRKIAKEVAEHSRLLRETTRLTVEQGHSSVAKHEARRATMGHAKPVKQAP